MKRSLSLLLIMFFVGSALAQGPSKDAGEKYVFVISKVNYLKAISDAVSVSKEQGLDVSEVRVILCGESVKAFQQKHPLIESALNQDRIRLYACGLSLEQMEVDPSTLPPAVSTVRNGILEAMVLEKKGYKLFDL